MIHLSVVLFSRKNLKTRMKRDQSPLQKEEEQQMGYLEQHAVGTKIVIIAIQRHLRG